MPLADTLRLRATEGATRRTAEPQSLRHNSIEGGQRFLKSTAWSDMMRHKAISMGIAMALTTAVGAQLPFADDFNTDTSANYLQLAEDLFNTVSGTEDVDVTFAFDYSTFVDGSDSHTIPVAPNTTDSSQIGLRLAANVNDDNGATGEGAAVNLFPLDGGSPLVISAEANWRMTFDLYMNLGAGGTTEFVLAGAHMTGTFVCWRDAVAGSDGLGLANTGDGGGGEDYILYVGQGSGVAPESNDAPSGTLDPIALGFPGGEDNNLDPFYQALFPATNGSPTEQWVEVQVSVIDDRLRGRR